METLIKSKKANMGNALVIGMIFLFVLMFAGVVGNYFNANGQIDEETYNEVIKPLNEEQNLEQEDKSFLTSVIDRFSNKENETGNNGGTLEDRLYSEQNQDTINFKSTYSIIQKAPSILANIFEIPATSVFITFFVSCIAIYLAFVGYQELKGYFSKNN